MIAIYAILGIMIYMLGIMSADATTDLQRGFIIVTMLCLLVALLASLGQGRGLRRW